MIEKIFSVIGGVAAFVIVIYMCVLLGGALFKFQSWAF